MPRVAVIIVLLLVVIGGGYLFWTYQRPQQQLPTNLTFSLQFPKTIVAGQSGTANVTVDNGGADATGVSPVVMCDAISASSNPLDVRQGTSYSIPITITGKDVQDGSYSVVVYLQYSSGSGTNKTASKGTSIYLLPDVQFASIRYSSEFPFHLLPPYKNTIGKNDNTTLLFKVGSMSSSVIYSGVSVSAKLVKPASVPGLSIVPMSLAIGSIGPMGTTGDYGFAIISSAAPPGVYEWQISLYTKDNQLVIQQMLEITVTG